MLQMQRLVAILHQREQQFRNEPGFPASAYLSEGGEANCSWRLTIIFNANGPHLDQFWKSPVNQSYDCESNRREYAVKSRANPSQFTQIFALTGKGTAFTEFEFGAGRDTREAEPDAILLMECKNSLIHWMEPGDINVSALVRSGFDNLEPNYPEGFLIAFVDGSVWCIQKDVPRDAILPFFTLEGASTHNRDVELEPFALEKIPPLERRDRVPDN
jgi:hypothetical protein